MIDFGPNKFAPYLKDAFEKLSRLKRTLNRGLSLLNKALRKGPLEAGRLIRKNPRMLQGLHEELKRLAESGTVAQAEEALNEEVAEAKLTYKHKLEQALKGSDIPFTGEWPTYLLRDVVELQVDLRKERVKIDRKWLRSLEITKIIAAAQRLLRDLLDRPFDPEAFANTLVEAYKRSVGARGAGAADYIGIRVLFTMVNQQYGPSYTIRHFAIDLFRLIEAQNQSDISIRLDLSPARSPSTGILIPGRLRGYISGLRIQLGA